MGGLSKKIFTIKQLAEKDVPQLVLDSGNLLFKKSRRKGTEVSEKERERAAIFVQQLLRQQNALVAVGIKDLAAGTDFMQQLEKQFSVRFLSVNLVDPDDRKPIFTPYRREKLGNKEVVVIGLTGQLRDSDPGDLLVLSWKEVLPGVLAELTPSADIIILLSNYPAAENKIIAEQNPAIHLLFQAGSTSEKHQPEQVKNTLICQTGNRGKYQGVLDVHWLGQGAWYEDPSAKLAKKRQRLRQVEKKIVAALETQAGDKQQKSKQVERLQRYHRQLEKKVKLLEENQEKAATGKRYVNRFIALSAKVADDAETARLVEKVK